MNECGTCAHDGRQRQRHRNVLPIANGSLQVSSRFAKAVAKRPRMAIKSSELKPERQLQQVFTLFSGFGDGETCGAIGIDLLNLGQ